MADDVTARAMFLNGGTATLHFVEVVLLQDQGDA